MHTAESLVKESIELISLPDVYVRLRSVIDSPNASLSDVAHIIVHDPAITARLLKLVNSAYFGLASQVDTMTHAINLLGTEQVHDLVLATVVIDSFSGFSNDALNIYDFWYSSVYCAVTARLLAFHCDDLDTERPFIAGLLHKIGHLISYQKLPDESLASVELAKQNNLPLYLAEREVLGFDYAQLGAALMREWNLPQSLQTMTEFQVEPVKALSYQKETAIIHIASAITHNALADIPVTPETLLVNPACWQITGLSIDQMGAIKHEVDLQAEAVMQLLFTHKRSA